MKNCYGAWLLCLLLLTTAVAAAQQSEGARVCTDLDGKELACPDYGDDASRAPGAGESPAVCTDLDGRRLPCPDENGTPPLSASVAPAPVASAPATLAVEHQDFGAHTAGGAADDSAEPVPMAEPRSDMQTSNSPFSTSFFRDLAKDQRDIWTAPKQLRVKDVDWLLPAAAGISFLIGEDRGIQSHLSTDPSRISQGKLISNVGVATLVGAGGGALLWGKITKNDRLRETGNLSTEAAIDTLLATEALKFVAARQRPLEGDGRGHFFQGGSSFPSEHSAIAFSLATILAHEYPGPLTKFLAYGTAGVTAAARVIGQQHFTADVVVGSALGWYIGDHVYRRHGHETDGARYGDFERTKTARTASEMASPYVPLDSWIYPAMERLAALGYVKTAFIGMRPWTRMECSRLLSEAEATAVDSDTNGEGSRLIRDLRQEFSIERRYALLGENLGAGIESAYARINGISGTPLNDNSHFAETLGNDYGRPYGSGVNAIVGVSAHSEAGPIAFYTQGELQHSSDLPPLPASAQQAILATDGIPSAVQYSGVDRFRLLDSYVAVNLRGWQLSFGKQSLWWGSGQGSGLLFTDNAEPMWMLRLSQTTPHELPSFLKYLGPQRSEILLGRVEGWRFVRLAWPGFQLYGTPNQSLDNPPFVFGWKLSFKSTPNLEFGVSYTTVFAGYSIPITMGTFFHTFDTNGNAQLKDPGDRRTGFEFRYRLPKLRNWLVLYNDAMAEDEPNPIAYPRQSAMAPGLYMPRIPKIPKLDFRVEAPFTDVAALPNGFFYSNVHYAEGYTNYGHIMGSWVGRQGVGLQLWSTYWMSARKKLQLGYRSLNVNPDFMGGGTVKDFSVRWDSTLPHNVSLSSFVQYERWTFPVISADQQSSLSISLQFTLDHPIERIKGGAQR